MARQQLLLHSAHAIHVLHILQLHEVQSLVIHCFTVSVGIGMGWLYAAGYMLLCRCTRSPSILPSHIMKLPGVTYKAVTGLLMAASSLRLKQAADILHGQLFRQR